MNPSTPDDSTSTAAAALASATLDDGSTSRATEAPPAVLAKVATRDDGSTEAAMALGIEAPHYPMYVISGTMLRKLDALVTHEEAIKAGMLRRVLRVETEGRKSNKLLLLARAGSSAARVIEEPEAVQGSDVYFISHRWLRPSRDPAKAHPDDERGSKLRALKNFVGVKKWVWIDYLCVPQQAGPRKLRAISSLPFYCRACERFTALVADRADYLSRTWCQAELIVAMLPERLPHFRACWLHSRNRFYAYGDAVSGGGAAAGGDEGLGRVSAVLLDHVGDLSSCALTVAADAAPLTPLLQYAAAELEALLAWDASADRATTRTFGSGTEAIDAIKDVWHIPGWQPVRRAAIEAAAGRLRAALAKPPFCEYAAVALAEQSSASSRGDT